MSTVNGFQVGSETLKYNYESLENYNTPNFSSSSSKAYAIGDYVMYNGKLYKCTTATTGGTWNTNNWAEAILSDDVTEQSNIIDQLDGGATGQLLRKHSNADYDFEWSDVVDDFVTPQMFGAVGDGTTDDTTAIQLAFNSDKDVYFPSGTYLTSGVTITTTKMIYIEGTVTLKAMTLGQDHVISATATIFTHGGLYIDGDHKAFIGLKLEAGSNNIDSVTTDYCLVAGVYTNGSGSKFRRVRTVGCGTRIIVTGSYASNYAMSITGTMTDRDRAVFESTYAFPLFLFNEGDYQSSFSGRWFTKAVSYDSTNNTIGTSQDNPAGKIPIDYIGKQTALCIGGGIWIGGGSAMQTTFEFIDSRMNVAGVFISALYGHVINSYYSQSDFIPVAVERYNLGMLYNSITFEGSRSGYNFVSWLYDHSVISSSSTVPDVYALPTSMIAAGSGYSKDDVPVLLEETARRNLPGGKTVAGSITITEKTSDVFLTTNTNTITLSLFDTFGNGWTTSPSGFGLKTILFFPTVPSTQDIVFSLHSNLVEKGYSIYNGSNNELRIQRPATYVKATVMQLNKVFYITVEPITFATPAST